MRSGNLLIIGSAGAVTTALTWGGVSFGWDSAHVLVPLILGLLGMCGFFFYEARYARHPIVSQPCLGMRGTSLLLYRFRMPSSLTGQV